jgi:hypothetical protein
MLNFHQRKARRTARYMREVYGWKLRPCSACSGSGYYDHNGSPPCGACEGTGKERYMGPKAFTVAVSLYRRERGKPVVD